MRIYLAARYSRREELCGYRDEIHSRTGHRVQAEWLFGEHQISVSGAPVGEHGEALVETHDPSSDVLLRSGEHLSENERSERAAALRAKFALDDFRDVTSCDMLIAFTEEPRSSTSRGGRHVELGIALGQGKVVWLVGPRENIFCWLAKVRQFESWDQCLRALAAEEAQ